MMKVIVDPGSCHMGKLEYAKELIDVAVDCGADACKFQLFKDLPPNIKLPRYWFLELVAYGANKKMEVFASVFEWGAYDLVKSVCKSIKLAYSQRTRGSLYNIKAFENFYISGDIFTEFPEGTIKLFCIHEYPVLYEVNFDGIFPEFDGFSSHCMGIRQEIKAIEAGAKYLEFHITLDKSDITCPDHAFAKRPKEAKKLINIIRGIK